jgi:hypothetical protein
MLTSHFRIAAVLAAGLLFSACASSGGRETSAAPPVTGSDDILDLLTGFGESISKRNFNRAVQYLVPEDRARILNPQDQVPEDMQKALMALPLQRLTRISSVRVENGYLAGIYGLLDVGPQEAARNSEDIAEVDPDGASGEEMAVETPLEEAEPAGTGREAAELNRAVQEFFSAVRQKDWNAALSLMNENEKKALLDDKGRLKDSAKERLSRIDAANRNALVLQEGKLTGVTLLLPME